jgi:outer membrane murein-binding lipoprotein Lpp
MRLLAFILALLLLAGTVDPTRGWLIALTVVTGLAAFRPGFRQILSVRPAVDVRLAAFVLAVLLLAGTVDSTRDWLIGLTIVTGVAMVCPKIISVDLFGERERTRFWYWTTDSPWGRRAMDGGWGTRAQAEFDHWSGSRREPRRHRDDWGED